MIERKQVTWTHPSVDGAGIHTVQEPRHAGDENRLPEEPRGAVTVEVYHFPDGDTQVSVFTMGDPLTRVYVNSQEVTP